MFLLKMYIYYIYVFRKNWVDKMLFLICLKKKENISFIKVYRSQFYFKEYGLNECLLKLLVIDYF